MSVAWMNVLGWGVLAWFFFTLAAPIKVPGKAQSHYTWVAGIAGFCCALIAGTAARNAWPIPQLVGWFLGLGSVIDGIAFVVVLVVCLVTLAAIIPDQISGGATLGLGLALAWIIIPAALAAGVIPGKAGDWARDAYVSVSRPLVDRTEGTFG